MEAILYLHSDCGVRWLANVSVLIDALAVIREGELRKTLTWSVLFYIYFANSTPFLWLKPRTKQHRRAQPNHQENCLLFWSFCAQDSNLCESTNLLIKRIQGMNISTRPASTKVICTGSRKSQSRWQMHGNEKA